MMGFWVNTIKRKNKEPGGERMVNVMLKPCQVQVNRDNIFILLKDSYFTMEIDKNIYEFVDQKERKVIVNRETGKIENTDSMMAFKKEDNIVYIALSELTLMPEFLIEIYYIAKPYYKNKQKRTLANETDFIISELEQQNIKRLIDRALDEKNKKEFHELIKFLK